MAKKTKASTDIKLDEVKKAEVLPKYIKKWRQNALRTDPIDTDRAFSALQNLYKYLRENGNKEAGELKKLIVVDDLYQGFELAAKFSLAKSIDEVDSIQLEPGKKYGMSEKACYGQLEGYWFAYYDYIENEEPTDKHPLVDVVRNVVKELFIFWTFENYVVAIQRPNHVTFDDSREEYALKSIDDAPSMSWKTGATVFNLAGPPNFRTLLEMKLHSKMKGNENEA